MARRNYKHYIRRTHRYLGLCIGIQFIFWTVGGLYFSWTKIEEVRSEQVRAKQAPVPLPPDLLSGNLSPSNYLPSGANADLASFHIVNILGEAHYFLPYTTEAGEEGSILVRFSDGEKRGPISESEAREVAKAAMTETSAIGSVELIELGGVSKHHEYRGAPLPAYAVTFEGPESYTVYVSANDHQVRAVRSNTWRIFDFLWMLHTMDFEGRDNFNNYLLRAFSIFGIVTIMSGFLLFFVSSKRLRWIANKLGRKRT
ncbi:hypothetical protein BH24ACI3_BH24ACI3_10630 [soil metagenome]